MASVAAPTVSRAPIASTIFSTRWPREVGARHRRLGDDEIAGRAGADHALTGAEPVDLRRGPRPEDAQHGPERAPLLLQRPADDRRGGGVVRVGRRLGGTGHGGRADNLYHDRALTAGG